MKKFWEGLEKNHYIKLNENLYFCYVADWGSEKEYIYALASRMRDDETVLSIWGASYEPIDAIIEALLGMSRTLTENISKEIFRDFNIPQIAEMVEKKELHCAWPSNGWVVKYPEDDKNLGYGDREFEMSISIDGDECYPIHC